MDALLEPRLLIAVASTFVAGIVRGFSGFGAAMVQVPIFALAYPAPQAVAVVAGLGTLASLQLLPGAARHADWRQVGIITALAWLTVPLGAYVLLTLDPDVMRRAISGLVLAMVAVLASGWRYPGRPNAWSAGGTGALSGLINGATGVGGPPVVLYLLAGPNASAVNRASLIAYYTFLNGATCLSLAFHGVLDRDVLLRTLTLWPAQVASLWLGAWLFRRANDAVFRRMALVFMAGVAVFGLLYSR